MSTIRVTEIVAIVAIASLLALLTVLLRLYTRLLLIKNASRDDLFIGFAMICSCGVSIAIFCDSFWLGKHLAAAHPSNIPSYFKSLFVSIIVYTVGILLIKFSILQQFLRISAPGRTRKAVYVVVVLVYLAALATLLSCIFSCHPVAYFWNSSVRGGTCLNEEALYLANGGINIVTDLLLLIIPIFLLKDLAMPRLQKIFLIGIISLGGAAYIASILCLPTIITMFRTSDFLWGVITEIEMTHRLDAMDEEDAWVSDDGRGWLCRKAGKVRVEREFRIENQGS